MRALPFSFFFPVRSAARDRFQGIVHIWPVNVSSTVAVYTEDDLAYQSRRLPLARWIADNSYQCVFAQSRRGTATPWILLIILILLIDWNFSKVTQDGEDERYHVLVTTTMASRCDIKTRNSAGISRSRIARAEDSLSESRFSRNHISHRSEM